MSVAASWRPGSSLTYALTVTAASTPNTTPAGFTSGGGTAKIVNTGAQNVFVVFGVGAQTAVLPASAAAGQSGTMVKAGSTAYVDIPANADSFAGIADSAGNNTIYVQRGEGNGP